MVLLAGVCECMHEDWVIEVMTSSDYFKVCNVWKALTGHIINIKLKQALKNKHQQHCLEE